MRSTSRAFWSVSSLRLRDRRHSVSPVIQENRWMNNVSALMPARLFLNAAFSPVMAVPMRVTETMPMTMPRVVRPARSLFARSAAQAMITASLNSVRRVTGGRRKNRNF